MESAVGPIVVLGSLNADLVTRSKRLPSTGETVMGSTFAVYAGGKGANQAVGAAKLGADVWMLGAVGNDAFGDMLLGSLNSAGVNTSLIDRRSGPSGVAVINTDDDGNNRIVVVPGANAEVSTEYVIRHRRTIQTASVLLLQLEVPLGSVLLASSIAREAGVPVILDPAPARALPADLLRSVTWLTPNDSEADVLLGSTRRGIQSSAEEVLITRQRAQALLALGASNVLLKHGELGVVCATSDGNLRSIGAFPVAAVDTTAAGDAFNGGFAVALARGKSAEEAARFACAVAAVSVTRAGAQPSMPTRFEVDEFLKAHPISAR